MSSNISNFVFDSYPIRILIEEGLLKPGQQTNIEYLRQEIDFPCRLPN